MELPPGSKIMPATKLPSGHLAIRCDHFQAAGKPASSSTTTTAFKTELIGEQTPEQQVPAQQRGNPPHALITILAKAAARGDEVKDLETFESFTARHMEMGERLSTDTINRRKKIVMAYTSEELQVVSQARSDGTLTRLGESPAMLAACAEATAADATARCRAELKHLEELQMLSGLSASSSS